MPAAASTSSAGATRSKRTRGQARMHADPRFSSKPFQAKRRPRAGVCVFARSRLITRGAPPHHLCYAIIACCAASSPLATLSRTAVTKSALARRCAAPPRSPPCPAKPSRSSMPPRTSRATLPVVTGTLGDPAFDIGKLNKETGLLHVRSRLHVDRGGAQRGHLHRRRQRRAALSRLSDRAAGQAVELPRSRLSADQRRAADDRRSSPRSRTKSRITR